MIQQRRQFDIIDALAIIGFLIGYKNYEENVDQTTMQNTVKMAVSSVQEHLEEQDAKINRILRILGEENV